jgi:hypothetical protein
MQSAYVQRLIARLPIQKERGVRRKRVDHDHILTDLAG